MRVSNLLHVFSHFILTSHFYPSSAPSSSFNTKYIFFHSKDLFHTSAPRISTQNILYIKKESCLFSKEVEKRSENYWFPKILVRHVSFQKNIRKMRGIYIIYHTVYGIFIEWKEKELVLRLLSSSCSVNGSSFSMKNIPFLFVTNLLITYR